MIEIIEKNRYFFRLYFAFFLCLFLYQLTCFQSDALVFFSERRSAFADTLFKIMTRFGEEMAFLLVIAYFVLKKERKQALLILLTGFAVLFSSILLKMLFSHPRPYTVFENAELLTRIHLVEGYEILRGDNSFPSGHSMGGFALWTLMAFRYRNNTYLVTLFFIFAASVAVSRVYLFAHFPEDVLLGSALGILTALLMYHFFRKAMTPL